MKGYVPPLAFALIVVFLIVVAATVFPPIGETIKGFLAATK